MIQNFLGLQKSRSKQTAGIEPAWIFNNNKNKEVHIISIPKSAYSILFIIFNVKNLAETLDFIRTICDNTYVWRFAIQVFCFWRRTPYSLMVLPAPMSKGFSIFYNLLSAKKPLTSFRYTEVYHQTFVLSTHNRTCVLVNFSQLCTLLLLLFSTYIYNIIYLSKEPCCATTAVASLHYDTC